MNFLFWNIQKKSTFFNVIRNILITEDIDILMLAEFPINKVTSFLNIINSSPKIYNYEYATPISPSDKVKIFTRFPSSLLFPFDDRSPMSAKRFFSPYLKEEILIITCHLPSKINKSDANLSGNAEDVMTFINKAEEKAGHKRTIICGDFNMNPFDEGIIKATGFHAVMDKSIAKKNSSTIHGYKHHYLYNPMWGLLGDTGRGNASGTMYYNSSDHINYYWHIYDQVLIRPDLVDYFDSEKLQIITRIGDESLITNKNVLNKHFSDHLPIKFNFKI